MKYYIQSKCEKKEATFDTNCPRKHFLDAKTFLLRYSPVITAGEVVE